MKKLTIMAALAVAVAAAFADTKVGVVGILAGSGSAANLGTLAQDSTALGSLASKSTVARTDLADGVQTSLDAADSALQQSDVAISATDGNLSVTVGTASGTSAHQSLAAYATTTALESATNAVASAAGGSLTAALADYTKTEDLGSLATKSEVALSDLASGVQTSLGKADSAVQSVTVQTAGNGGISVSVDGGQAVSTSLGALATKSTVDADAIDVELGDFYISEGTGDEAGQPVLYKRASDGE